MPKAQNESEASPLNLTQDSAAVDLSPQTNGHFRDAHSGDTEEVSFAARGPLPPSSVFQVEKPTQVHGKLHVQRVCVLIRGGYFEGIDDKQDMQLHPRVYCRAQRLLGILRVILTQAVGRKDPDAGRCLDISTMFKIVLCGNQT